MAAIGWLILGALAGQALQLAVWYAVPAIAEWRERRRVRRAPAGGCLNLASVAAMYKQMYALDSMPKPGMPAMQFSELRKHKFHVVGAIDGGHAVTYPNAAAEVEAAVAEAHERLSRDSLAAGEVVGLADWIPKSAPIEDKP